MNPALASIQLVRRALVATTCALMLGAGARGAEARILRPGAAKEVGFDTERLDRALKFVEKAVGSGRIGGAGVLVARRGVVVAQRAYGTADLENRRPFAVDTIYPIASISKPIAVTAAMILVDDGRLGLEDPVERHLPAFGHQMFRTPAGDLVHRPFTLRHLMTHTSGLPSNSPLRKRPLREWLGLSLAESVDAAVKEPLVFEPGTRSQYSNIGIATLGRVVEVVSGRSFEAFVTERVFEPLGMSGSYYNVPKAMAGRVADGFFFRMKDGEFAGFEPHEPEFRIVNTMPNAGIFSTAWDLSIFLQTFLNGGAYGGRRILAPRTARMMLADQTPGLPSRWGLGWSLGTGRRDGGAAIFDEEVFGHLGAGRCLAWGDPHEELIGVLLMRPGPQQDSPSDVGDRFRHMVYAALDDPAEGSRMPRSDRPSFPSVPPDRTRNGGNRP
jgi:CubicO group peptidase (beta-lactamase class C family)